MSRPLLCICAAVKRAWSCVSLSEPHDTQPVQHALVHTLTPWHVPPLANPPRTPLCSITLDNRTMSDHCADLRRQPALAASDRIFLFASVEGHIGFSLQFSWYRNWCMLADYPTAYQRRQRRFLYNVHAAPCKLIVFYGIKTEIWMFEDNMVQKRGCGYDFNYVWAD